MCFSEKIHFAIPTKSLSSSSVFSLPFRPKFSTQIITNCQDLVVRSSQQCKKIYLHVGNTLNRISPLLSATKPFDGFSLNAVCLLHKSSIVRVSFIKTCSMTLFTQEIHLILSHSAHLPLTVRDKISPADIHIITFSILCCKHLSSKSYNQGQKRIAVLVLYTFRPV
jgi:hypothetical protein